MINRATGNTPEISKQFSRGAESLAEQFTCILADARNLPLPEQLRLITQMQAALAVRAVSLSNQL